MNRIRKGYALRLAQRLREMGHESIDAEVARLIEEAQWLINDKSMSVTEAFDRIEEALISSSPGPNVTQTAHEDCVFLCDAGLGGLARWLRAAGQQALWRPDISDNTLIQEAVRLSAAVLTTDSLIMERGVFRDRLIPSLWLPPTLSIPQQLARVFREFGVVRKDARCMTCGGELLRRGKESLKERIPPKTYRWLDEYFVCTDCGKLFWKGTHWMRVDEQLRTIIT